MIASSAVEMIHKPKPLCGRHLPKAIHRKSVSSQTVRRNTQQLHSRPQRLSHSRLVDSLFVCCHRSGRNLMFSQPTHLRDRRPPTDPDVTHKRARRETGKSQRRRRKRYLLASRAHRTRRRRQAIACSPIPGALAFAELLELTACLRQMTQ